MATCDKCGRALDDKYAEEWHWCTECRAKAGSAPFGLCEICGKALYENEKGGICSSCLQNAEELYEPERAAPPEDEQHDPHSGKGCAVVIAIGLLSIVIFACLSGTFSGDSTPSNASARSTAISEASSAAPQSKTEYERELEEEFEYARSSAKDAIKKVAANPETVNILFRDESAFTNDGIFIYDEGEVSFVDASGAKREERYKYAYITDEDQYVNSFLKIGDNVIYDYRDWVDKSTGVITSSHYTVSGRGYGQPVLPGNILNLNNLKGKIPPERLNQVEYDVEVAFITDVQTLIPTVTGKMKVNYQSFQFLDMGDNVIAVSIDFTSKNVLGFDLKYTAKAAYDYNPENNSIALMLLGVDDQVYYPAETN